MKVLVATRRGQGDKPGDFCWAVDGELVHFPVLICNRDQYAAEMGNPLGGCGCGRAFTGMNSHRGTTTAEVVERDISREDFATALASSLHVAGWEPCEEPGSAEVQAEVAELLELAESFPVGTVLSHSLCDVVPR